MTCGFEYDCCLTVEEEVDNGTVVGSVTHWSDFSDPSQFSFLLFGENSAPVPFEIDVDGIITTTARIDRDLSVESRCIQVSVQGTGQGDTVTNFIPIFAVEIEDINDNVPRFPASNFTREFVESPANTDVLCGDDFPMAVDPDDSSNGEITYTVAGGNTSYFSITDDPCLRIIKEVDRESTTSLFVTIKATDGGNKCSLADIFITVLDACDETPVFLVDHNPFELAIPEDQTNGSIVYTFLVEDLDEGVNSEVRYRIVENTPIPFRIDSISGGLQLTDALDWEDGTRDFIFTIEAVDLCQAPKTGMLRVHVEVQDVNEPAKITPTPDRREFSLLENSSFSDKLLSISVEDSDSQEHHGFTISILSGGEYFRANLIGSGLALITQKENVHFDREQQSEIDVRICINQTGKPPIYHWINVTIHVLDINDNLPELNETHFRFVENNAALDRFAQLSTVAFDQDLGEGGTVIAYQLISVHRYPDEVDFTGEFLSANENADTWNFGILLIPRTWDREVDGEFLNISVRLTDGGQRSVIRNITLEILDENDQYPRFSQTSYDFTLRENLLPGSTVGNITAIDGDKNENGTVFYSLCTQSSEFTINSWTGEITSLRELDRETKEKYPLSVMARDTGANPLNASGPVDVIITIGDVDDNTPVFDNQKTVFSVPEDTKVGTSVATIVASDADSGENAEIIYTLEPDSLVPFAIGVSSAVITVARSLEGEPREINFTVSAFSQGRESALNRSKLDITIVIVEGTSEDSTDSTALYAAAGAGATVVVGIVAISAVLACLLCWTHRRRKRRSIDFPSGSPTAMNNEIKPRKSSIKPPSSGEQSAGVPSRRVQFENKVKRMYYDTKQPDTDGLYKVESDLLAVSDGESPQALPRHMNGTIVPGDAHPNGVPPQYYPQPMPPYVVREVANAELELSESTTDDPNNYDGNSDEDSTSDDDNISNINAQITRFEERVPSLGPAMRFPNPIPHPPHYQHTPSPPHLLASLPPHPHYDPHHHSGSLTLTPPQKHHTHSLSSHASASPNRQLPPSISPSHFHAHRLPPPHLHSPLSHSHGETYPAVMPRALSGGDTSPTSILQPYASFMNDLDSCTYESSVLDEELEFHQDTKPEFISLTATDVYSYDEETDQL